MRAPVVAVGDEAGGFSRPLFDVVPAAGDPRCSFHTLAPIVDAHPGSIPPLAHAPLGKLRAARHARDARTAVDTDRSKRADGRRHER